MSTVQSSRQPRTTAIFGVSGKLGSLIATHILNHSSGQDVKVHGFCRDTSKLSSTLIDNPSFSIFTGEALSADDIRCAVIGCDTVISTYNSPRAPEWTFDAEKLLIDVCVEEEVKRYFPSSFTGDFTKLRLNDFPLVDPRIKVLHYLEDGKHAGSLNKLTPVHVLSAGYMEILFRMFLNPNDLFYYGSEDDKWGLSSYNTCASFVAEVVLDKEEPTGFFRFGDCTASVKEIAGAVSRVKRNGEPVATRKAGTREELKTIVDQSREEGTLFENLVPQVYPYLIVADKANSVLSRICHYWFPSPDFGIADRLDNHKYPSVRTLTLEEAVEKFVT